VKREHSILTVRATGGCASIVKGCRIGTLTLAARYPAMKVGWAVSPVLLVIKSDISIIGQNKSSSTFTTMSALCCILQVVVLINSVTKICLYILLRLTIDFRAPRYIVLNQVYLQVTDFTVLSVNCETPFHVQNGNRSCGAFTNVLLRQQCHNPTRHTRQSTSSVVSLHTSSTTTIIKDAHTAAEQLICRSVPQFHSKRTR